MEKVFTQNECQTIHFLRVFPLRSNLISIENLIGCLYRQEMLVIVIIWGKKACKALVRILVSLEFRFHVLVFQDTAYSKILDFFKKVNRCPTVSNRGKRFSSCFHCTCRNDICHCCRSSIGNGFKHFVLMAFKLFTYSLLGNDNPLWHRKMDSTN